jgi:hypothetical protein
MDINLVAERRERAMASHVTDRHLGTSKVRVATRYLEAGPSEWLQWFAQPFEVIWKHHKDFVYGPVDDAVDAIIKELAPQMVKAIVEEEVDEDVDEFTDGAIRGRWDAQGNLFQDPDPEGTVEFAAGYAWGYTNAVTFKGNALPAGVRGEVVKEYVQHVRTRITEEVIERALMKAWHAISPGTTLKAILSAVRKHGWKLGLGFALFEVFEHMLLPTVLIALTGHEELAITATLPIGEIVYAVVFRVLGHVPHEMDTALPEGHLDWYEAKFGPVRIACLTGA